MARYVPGTVPLTSDIQQVERFLRDETEQIRSSTDDSYTMVRFILDQFTVAGYGGIGLDAATPLSDINATWQTLPFDIELIAEPKGVGYALGSNALAVNEVGVWRMNAKVSLTFLELNAGRQIQLRVQNVTVGTPAATEFNFAVGRNTDGVNLNFNLLVVLPEESVGDAFALQVASAADTFTGVTAIGSIFDINHVSEYKGDLFDRVEGVKTRWL